MISLKNKIIVLANGRDFHAMDWFRSAQKLCPDNPPLLVTDLIEGEAFPKLIEPSDQVHSLVILDRYLFRNQCHAGDIWRNILKLLMLPIQIFKLRKIVKENNYPLIHAHTMYYTALARFSGCAYVATPQGDEILGRPYRSYAYKIFARIALSRAFCITVDSTAMQDSLNSLYGLKSLLIQNGINIKAISQLVNQGVHREHLVSMRGFAPNYCIDKLLDARNNTMPNYPIHFSYPFVEQEYKNQMAFKLIDIDRDLGRLDSRHELYQLFRTAKLVISIPTSDSSPRSVYEAIFCGCFVAVTNSGWINQLPGCMRSRLILVDLRSETWLIDAMTYAEANKNVPYVPSEIALNMFDQERSMLKFYEEIYPLAKSRRSC